MMMITKKKRAEQKMKSISQQMTKQIQNHRT